MQIAKPVVFAVLALIAGCNPGPVAEETMVVDQLIAGGTVFDGSGAPSVETDIGIKDGRIVFLGDSTYAGVTSENVIDAKDLWVAPGFIDAHSHAELDKDYGRDAAPYLHQGITTVVLGLDGDGSSDVRERLDAWRDKGIGVNGIHFVGHGHIRGEVLGREDRAPEEREQEAMRALVRKAMEEGAYGLSTGLFYVPGTYASTDEVIDLAKVAAEYPNAYYDTHDRDLGAVYQGVGYDASVEEGIRIIEESGLRGIFSHFNLQGAQNYGRAAIGAKYINDARARGVDVWAAQHPYTATQSTLRSYLIPDWAAAGGQEAMLGRFDEAGDEIVEATNAMLAMRGGADKILFADPRPDLSGKTLAEVAALQEMSAADTVQWILREANAVVMNLDLYDLDNTRILARQPWMMTCTDGRTPRPDQPITHPRTFGAFPMKMRLFVFEEKILKPEFVIRSFSGLAADFFRLADRGYIRRDFIADLVVIDPDRYLDKATYEEPRQLAQGVVHAIVNGRFAIRDGKATGELAGVPLLRPE